MAAASDTIYALSSGNLPAGVAVVRISGPKAFDLARLLIGEIPSPRYAALRPIRRRNGQIIDTGLVLAFPSPNSFTGEDSLELQVHGSKAVVAALFDELSSEPGCRLAEAGEFSRRAFENGKLDLVEIEGLADLVVAETEMQRRLAVEHTNGHLSALYESWREKLVRARALIEAELDFADEEDIPGGVSAQIWPELSDLEAEITSHLAGQGRGEIVRDGFKVVIAGPPNAGKSSLLNALAEREVAIVTEVAGTTRDIVHCDLNLGGYFVRLYDTAGIRETEDVVEREGIRRAMALKETADLVLLLNEGDQPLMFTNIESVPVRYVATKIDKRHDLRIGEPYDIGISTKTGVGLDALRDLLVDEIEKKGGGGFVVPSRRRHAEHLRRCADALATSLENRDLPLEVRAEFLREASDELGRLTGRIDSETLLGAIFSEFCVGK